MVMKMPVPIAIHLSASTTFAIV